MKLEDFDKLGDEDRENIWNSLQLTSKWADTVHGPPPRGWQRFDAGGDTALQLQGGCLMVVGDYDSGISAVFVPGVTVADLRLAAEWCPPEEDAKP